MSLYTVWKNMRQRCFNPRNPAFKNYGGRGITICDRWDSFALFAADMGEPPFGCLLERKDNEQGYYPENCEWTERTDQNSNKRKQQNNTSGLAGVHYSAVQRVWIARGSVEDQRGQLYRGVDFFLACCARKSWDRFRCK